MDEIDAALDFRNVSIVANYIKDRTKNAQFKKVEIIAVHFSCFAIRAFVFGAPNSNKFSDW